MTRTLLATFFCMGLTVSSAAAQDLACAAPDATAEWIGGNAAASDITTTDRINEQLALVLNGNTYIAMFTLSDETDVRLEAAGRGNGDPLITLSDESGTEILSDDDSGSNRASRAETTLPAGSYCLAVTSYEGRPMTAFVRIARTEQEALTRGPAPTVDPESSCAAGLDLGTIGDRYSLSTTAQDTPFMRFTLDTPRTFSLTAQGTDADPKLELFDADTDMIAENDDFDGLNAQIDLAQPLPAGSYCVALTAIADPAAPIEFAISAYDAEQALTALYDSGEAAPQLDGSHPVTDLGTLTEARRTDLTADQTVTWYSLDIPNAGLLLAEARSITPETDPWIALFDSLGREIAKNDDGGDGLNSMIATRLPAGTILIGIKNISDIAGTVSLVLERFVPEP